MGERRDAYSPEDVARLLAVADPVERVLILLGGMGALRISEALALEWRDVDLDRARLVVRHGKGGKRATVSLPGPVVEALRALPRREGRVLPWKQGRTARVHLRALCQQAGVTYERRQFHGLRHHAASTLLRQTGNILLASKHLRHSSISTTQIYAKLDRDDLEVALSRWTLGQAADD